MYAVVEAGGRQYQLTSGRFVDVDMVSGEPDQNFVFDKVVMIVDGDKSTIGKPIVAGAKVSGRIIAHGKGKKMIVYHYRPKKGLRKRQGHRQGYTRIFIDSISLNDKVLSEAKAEDKKPRARANAATAEKAPKSEKATKKAEAKAKAQEKPTKEAKPAKKASVDKPAGTTKKSTTKKEK